MQNATCLVEVPILGLFFPFNLPRSIIAYRVEVTGDRGKGNLQIKITFKEPTKEEVALPRLEFGRRLEAAGYSLSRIAVLHENIGEYVSSDALEPVVLALSDSKWTFFATDQALVAALMRAMTRQGDPDIRRHLARLGEKKRAV
jgi:hypothetical protein